MRWGEVLRGFGSEKKKKKSENSHLFSFPGFPKCPGGRKVSLKENCLEEDKKEKGTTLYQSV